jgi:hypothetical protein
MVLEVGMKKMSAIWALVVWICGVQLAFAGAPLKGIDVKLGKNPGGGCAARVSGDGGEADFGVWPKGNYTVTFSTATLTASGRGVKPEKLHVEIQGSVQGTITHVLPTAMAESLVPIEIVSDGKTPLVVKVSDGVNEPVDWARVKSHSNINNN